MNHPINKAELHASMCEPSFWELFVASLLSSHAAVVDKAVASKVTALAIRCGQDSEEFWALVDKNRRARWARKGRCSATAVEALAMLLPMFDSWEQFLNDVEAK